jgi:hypothetical protein
MTEEPLKPIGEREQAQSVSTQAAETPSSTKRHPAQDIRLKTRKREITRMRNSGNF